MVGFLWATATCLVEANSLRTNDAKTKVFLSQKSAPLTSFVRCMIQSVVAIIFSLVPFLFIYLLRREEKERPPIIICPTTYLLTAWLLRGVKAVLV